MGTSVSPCLARLYHRMAIPASVAAASTATQGPTLVHFSAQLKHILRDTLGGFSGSGTKNGSG